MIEAFICNGMVGKLCKYLRMCGFDVLYQRESAKAQVQAMRENRILLTRNTKIKTKANVFLLESDNAHIQFKLVFDRFNMKESVNFFSRCLLCNELLAPVKKESVRKKVPYFTYQNIDEYAQCPKCSRIYWKGSHYQKMLSDIKKHLNLE